jgi:hypothetical protein
VSTSAAQDWAATPRGERPHAVGAHVGEGHEQYITDILAAVRQETVFSKITNLRDGRIISIVNNPITDGGWVATHEDPPNKSAPRRGYRMRQRGGHRAYVARGCHEKCPTIALNRDIAL